MTHCHDDIMTRRHDDDNHGDDADDDGKSGDGAGTCIEIPKEFFLD